MTKFCLTSQNQRSEVLVVKGQKVLKMQTFQNCKCLTMFQQ